MKGRGLVGSLVVHLSLWLIGSFTRLRFPTISVSPSIPTKSAGIVGFIAWVVGDGDGEEACSGLKCPFFGWVCSSIGNAKCFLVAKVRQETACSAVAEELGLKKKFLLLLVIEQQRSEHCGEHGGTDNNKLA